MEPIRDVGRSKDRLVILEKYEHFLLYIYPLLKNINGSHKVLRDKTIELVIAQCGLFNDAAKTSQISRFYLADAGMATIRDHLRLLTHKEVKALSRKQYGFATLRLSEVGAMFNAWISTERLKRNELNKRNKEEKGK